MKQRNCISCGQPIPKERLAILPDTQHCVRCSDVPLRTAEEAALDTPDLSEMNHGRQFVDDQ